MIMSETINISKFYSKKNEEEGVWFEPRVKGLPSGVEFKLYGPNSTPAAIAHDMYAKVKDDINKIEDLKAKNDRLDKALAEYAASLVCDIRGKDGKLLKHDDGTTVTVSDVKEILYEAPVLATAIANFQSNQNNFLQL